MNIRISALRRTFAQYARGYAYFAGDDISIGRHVRFGRNVVFNCNRVKIGDGVIFHDNITIDADSFEIGDYGTIYSDCFFPGPGSIVIGCNFWLGKASIVDCRGGTTIGNNVGVGPHSQLWTHMIYGDVLFGCRFRSQRELVIGDDVWFVGHCLVSPIAAGDRSLAMLGSLITRDMQSDRTYAGVPAADITDKVGAQFEPRPLHERVDALERRVGEFARQRGLPGTSFARVVRSADELVGVHDDVICFNVEERTYTKRGTKLEYELIRYLLPEAKFVPVIGRDNENAVGGLR